METKIEEMLSILAIREDGRASQRYLAQAMGYKSTKVIMGLVEEARARGHMTPGGAYEITATGREYLDQLKGEPA